MIKADLLDNGSSGCVKYTFPLDLKKMHSYFKRSLQEQNIYHEQDGVVADLC